MKWKSDAQLVPSMSVSSGQQKHELEQGNDGRGLAESVIRDSNLEHSCFDVSLSRLRESNNSFGYVQTEIFVYDSIFGVSLLPFTEMLGNGINSKYIIRVLSEIDLSSRSKNRHLR